MNSVGKRINGPKDYLEMAFNNIPDNEKKAATMLIGEFVKDVDVLVADSPGFELGQLQRLANIVDNLSKPMHASDRQQIHSDEPSSRKYKVLLGAARQSVFFDALDRKQRAIINKEYRIAAKMNLREKFIDFCKEIWRDLTRAEKLNDRDEHLLGHINISRPIMASAAKKGTIPFLKASLHIVGRPLVENDAETPLMDGGEKFKKYPPDASTARYIDKYAQRTLERIRQLEEEQKGTV
jgi:hypothetical protein